jgi:hypothetical protein
VMVFSETAGGSRLHYTIVFKGKLPLIAAVIKPVLDRAIRKGLNDLRL